MCFAGTTYRQHQEFHLAGRAGLLYRRRVVVGPARVGRALAVRSLHEPADSARATADSLCSTRCRSMASDGELAGRMGRFDVVLVAVLIGPVLEPHAATLVGRACHVRLSADAPTCWSGLRRSPPAVAFSGWLDDRLRRYTGPRANICSSCPRCSATTRGSGSGEALHASDAPRIDKLVLHQAGFLAQKRLARGLRLNYPEAVALIATQVLEFIRDGRAVAELMDLGRRLLGRRRTCWPACRR